MIVKFRIHEDEETGAIIEPPDVEGHGEVAGVYVDPLRGLQLLLWDTHNEKFLSVSPHDCCRYAT